MIQRIKGKQTNGDILKYVKCVSLNNLGSWKALTMWAIYPVISQGYSRDTTPRYVIIDDNGLSGTFYTNRFIDATPNEMPSSRLKDFL